MIRTRIIILIGLLAVLTGCQTGGTDTAGALSSAAGSGEAVPSAHGEALPLEASDDASSENAESTDGEIERKEAGIEPGQAATQKAYSDPVTKGVQQIAAIRSRDGESAAVLAVFACYKKARDRSVTQADAKICAAQDFAVSREVISNRPANATGTGDRNLLVSKRHAERIGALMKLKGMNQSQFNTFAAFLHAVAEPTYQTARKS